MRANPGDGLGDLACPAGQVEPGDHLGGGCGENGVEIGQGAGLGLGADRQGDQIRRVGSASGKAEAVIAILRAALPQLRLRFTTGAEATEPFEPQ